MEIIVFNFVIQVITWTLAWLLVELFKEIQKQKQPSKSAKPSPKSPQPTSQTPASPVEPSLESRLFSMMAGDKAACYRLVEAARRQYPGKTERWYWEKTIQDLIRDRH